MGAVSRIFCINLEDEKSIMADEFLVLPPVGGELPYGNRTEDYTTDPTRGRKAVRMLLLGEADPVQHVIQELHRCRFCDVGVWSRPLRIIDQPQQLLLNPGEVMRIYKHYLTR